MANDFFHYTAPGPAPGPAVPAHLQAPTGPAPIRLLADLGDEDWEKFIGYTARRRYPAGAVVVRPGGHEPGAVFCRLAARCRWQVPGAAATLRGEGEVVGLLSFLDAAPHARRGAGRHRSGTADAHARRPEPAGRLAAAHRDGPAARPGRACRRPPAPPAAGRLSAWRSSPSCRAGAPCRPTPFFGNYTQLRSALPPLAVVVRCAALVLAITLGLVGAVAAGSRRLGLTLFWGLAVPLLPAVLVMAPGLWRQVCPMATLNQLPRQGGFTPRAGSCRRR